VFARIKHFNPFTFRAYLPMLTYCIAHIQERLRQQALTQRRSLLHTDTATVTIGQASILSELKLANDNLRWRLQQKCSVVSAQQDMIESLQRQLAEERAARGTGSGSGSNGAKHMH